MKSCEYWPKGGKEPPAEVGETVLIWGDHYGAADAAEKLGVDGRQVILVTPHKEFGLWMEPCHKDVFVKRIKGGNGEALTSKTFAHPVIVIPNSSVLEIRENGEVVLVDSKFQRSTVKADTVVLAELKPEDTLYRSYLAAGLPVAVIGDAKRVRNLRGAVTDGANRALTLDKGLMLNANAEIIAHLPAEIAG
jgi:hypothetical protein